jgi:hypothetical protein
MKITNFFPKAMIRTIVALTAPGWVSGIDQIIHPVNTMLTAVDQKRAKRKANLLSFRIAHRIKSRFPFLIFRSRKPRGQSATFAALLATALHQARLLPVMDAEKLLSTVRCHSVVFHLLTGLTPETEVYADKMMAVLKGAHEIYRETHAPFDGREEICLRRELRQLLILLKGNDVWVYETSEFKHLPESYEVQPRDKVETWFQSIIAFGPAGEYGENTVRVPVDHGAPWLHNPNIAF